MRRGSVRLAVVALSLMAPVLAAQDRSKDMKATSVPESAMPPAGMCRLWLPDVPERQQPAHTDCATAIRTAPRDAMVLFGDLKRAARLTTPGAAAAQQRQAAQRQSARDVRGFTGPTRMVDPRSAPGPRGAQTTTANTATARPGTSGAGVTKAPETKAAVIKPPENRQ